MSLCPQNGESIMVEVATGGGQYILPMVLKVPYIVRSAYPECQSPSFSLLGQCLRIGCGPILRDLPAFCGESVPL